VRAEIYDQLICVTLSERNVLLLLARLRHSLGKGLISGDIYVGGQAVDGMALVIAAEPDEAHYCGRDPGEFDMATEAWIEDHRDLLDPNRHPVERLMDLKLMPSGRIMSASKTAWTRAFPTEVGIFNANVFARPEGGQVMKVWHGDLNLTREEPALVQVAAASGQTIWVLFERDGRFGGKDEEPELGRAVLCLHPGGGVAFDESYLVRAEDGTLRLRHVYERETDPAAAEPADIVGADSTGGDSTDPRPVEAKR
jgi:hypothetical protein